MQLLLYWRVSYVLVVVAVVLVSSLVSSVRVGPSSPVCNSIEFVNDEDFRGSKMALGPLQIFRSKCQGVGYWTHFLLGAFVAIVKLSGYDACNCGAFSLSNVLAATLIMYQIFDYLYGEELMMSDEFALFRDLMEYVIGYVLVMVGSYMQKRKRSQSRATQVSSPGTSASSSARRCTGRSWTRCPAACPPPAGA